MKRSYLIQRLNKPIDVEGDGPLAILLKNPFSFGGGLRNGGLPQKAMDILRKVFEFDYMGAAEFEFGAVPEALATIQDSKTLVTEEIEVDFTYKDWRENETFTGSKTVFVICPKENMKEACKRIKTYGNNDVCRVDTKERVLLDEAMARGSKTRVCGWLEISNGFFFFTDREMFEQVCGLFGVVSSPIT